MSALECVPSDGGLAEGPFTALRYHFGMLLGVDDFETEQRYLRSKSRLHNAWLHRAGIVCGLGVDVIQDKRELRVARGLALDGAGRELHLDVRCCMDIVAWYEDNAASVETRAGEGGAKIFDGRVELAFCACATRPVPAVAGPCEGAEVDTAYSRTFETVAIRFVPELAVPPDPPYPRLRLLFGLDEGQDVPDRAEVLAAQADVLAQPVEQQALALLGYFRTFADRDVTDLDPAEDADGALAYPESDDAVVVLANLRDITLAGGALTSWELDLTPRRTLVATATLQELLCGPVLSGVSAGPSALGPDAGGPRVVSSAVDRPARKVTLTTDKPLAAATVGHDAFRVARLEDAGWEPIRVASADLAADERTVTLTLHTDPGTDPLRVIARGSGQTPLLGTDHVPLAGGPDSPPGGSADGHDFVLMST